MVGAVDRQRNGDFRSGDHVDRCFPGFENLKHFTQKAVSQQHIGRFYFNGRDPVFSGNRLDILYRTVFGDQGSFVFRAKGVL